MAAEAGTEIVAMLAAPVPIPIEVGHRVAETLLSLGWAVNETLPVSVLIAGAIMEAVALPPGGTVIVFGLEANINPAVTFAVTCAVAVFPLLSVPVRSMVYSSRGVPTAAVIFNASVSLPGRVTGEQQSLS
jgi:hypothetical protein